MAKQPTIPQIEQLIKDLRDTKDRSSFPAVREQASLLLPVAEQFRERLAAYAKAAMR